MQSTHLGKWDTNNIISLVIQRQQKHLESPVGRVSKENTQLGHLKIKLQIGSYFRMLSFKNKTIVGFHFMHISG